MYILDFALVSLLIIGITALLGVISNGIGIHLFGRKNRSKFVDQSDKSTAGFNMVGGNKKS